MAHLLSRVRRLRVALVTVGLVLALTATAASPALAAPGENASCMGHEQSAINPPGSSAEFPAGASELREFAGAIAAALGVPVGQIYRIVASLHAGSHELCDEALGG